MLKSLKSVAVLSVFVAAGCSDSIGPGDIAGTYFLQSINGDQVPSVIFEDADERTEVLSGEFVIRTDGTFTSILVVRETFQGTTTDEESIASGTYDLDGRDIIFEDSEFGDTISGRISGDDLIFEELGLRLVFSR